MAETRQFGDIASKLLMENDRVRVWEMRLEPGERSALHRHDRDYVMIQISGDKMAVSRRTAKIDGIIHQSDVR